MIECMIDSNGEVKIDNGRYCFPINRVVNREELPNQRVPFYIEKVIAKIPVDSKGSMVEPRLNIWHCSWTNCEFYLKGIKY